MYFCDTGEQCGIPYSYGERWQSPRVGILECDSDPAKHILLGYIKNYLYTIIYIYIYIYIYAMIVVVSFNCLVTYMVYIV